MTDLTTPLTVIQDANDPEWQRLIARFWRGAVVRPNRNTRMPLDLQYAARRVRRERMMTAVRKLDEGRAA